MHHGVANSKRGNKMIKAMCKKGNFIYVLSATRINTIAFGKIQVYGISICSGRQSVSVKDISNDYTLVRYLFDLIVEEELYPEHLYDVVEDYLSGNLTKIISSITLETSHPQIA